jgi:hypothetical protein
MGLDSQITVSRRNKRNIMLSKKAWEKLGEDTCFLCGKSLQEHIQDKGKRFDMYCRTEYQHLMESWNWKTVCIDCRPVFEKIERQVLD